MKDIVEIRWHGRGGQGAKTASLLLAAFDTTIAGLIAAADKDHAETGTYYIVRDSRSSGGSR